MLKWLKNNKSTVFKLLSDGFFIVIVIIAMIVIKNYCDPSVICGVCPGSGYFNLSNLPTNITNFTIIK